MAASPSARDLVDPVLAAHPPRLALGLRFDGVPITIRTNAPELVQRLERYFAESLDDGRPARVASEIAGYDIVFIQADPPPLDGLRFDDATNSLGPTHGEQHATLADGRCVRNLGTGMTFFVTSDGANTFGLNAAIGDCLGDVNQLLNFICGRLIEYRLARGHLLCHAAAVTDTTSGRGVAIAGIPAAGKSTLALRLLSRNCALVSDDCVLVSERGKPPTMRGLPKQPRVKAGTALEDERLVPVLSRDERKRLEALPKAELWDQEHKYDALVHELYGSGSFRVRATLDAIVMLNCHRDDPGELRFERTSLADRRDLLESTVMNIPGDFILPNDATRHDAEHYLGVLEGIPVYEIRGAFDIDSASAHCVEVLERGGSE